MWTQIVVGDNASSLKSVKECIKRSGALPLDILVQNTENSAFAFTALSTQSHRWQSLYIKDINDWAIDLISTLPLPLLRSLRIDSFVGGMWEVVLDTPRLKHLIINDVDVTFKDALPPPLCSFSIPSSWFEWDPLWPYLQSSQSSLQKLKVKGTDDQVRILEGPALSLSVLTEYEVSLPTLDWNALRIANMPALTRLSLFWGCPMSSPTMPRDDTILPLMPALRILDLSTEYDMEIGPTIIPLLLAAPNIRQLSIADTSSEGPHVDSKSTESLRLVSEADEDVARFCRELEELRITGTPVRIADLEDIVALRPSLRTIFIDTVDWNWENLDTDRVILQRLRQAVDLTSVNPMWYENYYKSEPIR
ncbi:hypothetical protein FRC04_000791 [Tulasnella sp. 424]|nr:hypothetical protein FRC04_000791 [Tulasnella sp. 424]